MFRRVSVVKWRSGRNESLALTWLLCTCAAVPTLLCLPAAALLAYAAMPPVPPRPSIHSRLSAERINRPAPQRRGAPVACVSPLRCQSVWCA